MRMACCWMRSPTVPAPFIVPGRIVCCPLSHEVARCWLSTASGFGPDATVDNSAEPFLSSRLATWLTETFRRTGQSFPLMIPFAAPTWWICCSVFAIEHGIPSCYCLARRPMFRFFP